mmetsp:Transcript_59508/g.168676  ORF Transcript_59508/g.168676 Transcript_59508/m.168676 type:complete len:245 (-) Transcript_59508:760-1494(-)
MEVQRSRQGGSHVGATRDRVAFQDGLLPLRPPRHKQDLRRRQLHGKRSRLLGVQVARRRPFLRLPRHAQELRRRLLRERRIYLREQVARRFPALRLPCNVQVPRCRLLCSRCRYPREQVVRCRLPLRLPRRGPVCVIGNFGVGLLFGFLVTKKNCVVGYLAADGDNFANRRFDGGFYSAHDRGTCGLSSLPTWRPPTSSRTGSAAPASTLASSLANRQFGTGLYPGFFDADKSQVGYPKCRCVE